jgi:hypothetical protein
MCGDFNQLLTHAARPQPRKGRSMYYGQLESIVESAVADKVAQLDIESAVRDAVSDLVDQVDTDQILADAIESALDTNIEDAVREAIEAELQ